LIDSFAPECREGVTASDIAAAVGFISVFLPQLADVEIEAVDLGKLIFETTDEGILVLPEDPDASASVGQGAPTVLQRPGFMKGRHAWVLRRADCRAHGKAQACPLQGFGRQRLGM
jgi:hypothetical protein